MSEELDYIAIVFDGPPSHDSGRFVECETPDGRSINAGEWVRRDDGLWELRIPSHTALLAAARERDELREWQRQAVEALRLPAEWAYKRESNDEAVMHMSADALNTLRDLLARVKP